MSDSWKKELHALGADATRTECFEILSDAIDQHLLGAIREIGGSLGGNGPRLDIMLTELAMAAAYVADLRGAAFEIAREVKEKAGGLFPTAGKYSGPAPENSTAAEGGQS